MTKVWRCCSDHKCADDAKRKTRAGTRPRRLSHSFLSAVLTLSAYTACSEGTRDPLDGELSSELSTVGATITRSEVLERARDWFTRNPQLTYDKSRAASTLIADVDGAHRYGPDCSGMVSMAWHLQPGSVGGLNTGTLPSVSDEIAGSSLLPGDILDYPSEHTILFEAWESDHIHFSYYSFGHTPMSHYTHASLEDGDGSGKLAGWPVGLYHAYRYRNVIDDPIGDDGVVGYSPDFDGDGLGDLVATSTTGVLTSYVNTSTPGHPEFGIQKTIGSAWNGITKIAVLDIDNDGKLDLVGTSTTGVLTAYFNTSTAQSIVFGNQLNFGSGWTSVTKLVVIDIDHDGRQDLVAVNSSGQLVAYLSNGTPGHPGFSAQPVIGSGWNATNRIMVMDIDNDGKQDLVATNTSGQLVAYLSNGTPGHPGFSAQPVIGSGWNSVSRIAVIDIDNDGKQDLVATSTTGTLTAYLSNGTPGHPGFSAQPVIGSSWNSIAKIVVVDVDGDGKQDLLGMGTNGALTAYLSTGTPGHPGFVSQPPVIGSGWNSVSRVATVR
jgi:VCBS repeat protein